MRCDKDLDREQHSENIQDRVNRFPFTLEDFHQWVRDESKCDTGCDA